LADADESALAAFIFAMKAAYAAEGLKYPDDTMGTTTLYTTATYEPPQPAAASAVSAARLNELPVRILEALTRRTAVVFDSTKE
jgi:hypothetical protein